MKSNSFRAAKYSIGVFLTVIGLTYGLSIPLRSSSTAASSGGPAGEAPPPSASATGMMFTPSLTAVKSHSPAGPFHLGDTITYSTTITNNGPGDATGVEFTDTPDANTTFVNGSVMASPVAVDDSYTCTGNLSISIAAPGVLGNDFKGLNPAVTSISAF